MNALDINNQLPISKNLITDKSISLKDQLIQEKKHTSEMNDAMITESVEKEEKLQDLTSQLNGEGETQHERLSRKQESFFKIIE